MTWKDLIRQTVRFYESTQISHYIVHNAQLTALDIVYWSWQSNYIDIHHSAGVCGGIAFLNKFNQQWEANDPIAAIPYHDVIGNDEKRMYQPFRMNRRYP